MKKLWIILNFLPFFAFGQKSGLSIDVLFSPDFYVPPQVYADAAFYQESAYHLGFNVVKSLEKHPQWSFRSGVRYHVYNQRVEGFYSLTGNFERYTSYTASKYFDIPLAVRYSFGAARLRGYAELIASMSIKTNSCSCNQLYQTLGFSLGLEYQITPTLGVFAQPTVRVPLKGIYEYALAAGIELGVKYRLPK